jgi:hypothetical protein
MKQSIFDLELARFVKEIANSGIIIVMARVLRPRVVRISFFATRCLFDIVGSLLRGPERRKYLYGIGAKWS